MDSVKVKRIDLLEIVKSNRETHRETFEKATEGWRERVITELDKAIQDAKAGRKYRTTFNLPQPKDYTSQYDEIIGLLGMSVDDLVELTQFEYRQYVNDDWGWKADFVNNSTQYLPG